ncbi:hypothetical protein OJAV_G00060890 [Oryzias javanicus]|uniref:Coactosin-like protein n=1 Tax=Oryzias javanicus TaxID=123683 RepID=A0A437DBU4_ORYJA|nr:hypothetical protein OJAV_G00060890 [Oryzias javanicus]
MQIVFIVKSPFRKQYLCARARLFPRAALSDGRRPGGAQLSPPDNSAPCRRSTTAVHRTLGCVASTAQIDKEACREAYNDVRDDSTETNWAAFKYEGSTIVPAGQGTDYEDFKNLCSDDTRLFGFVRFMTGDAMSKRVKFTLITWIGENVSGLQRAKISTDKTMIKDIVQTFAKEFMISDPEGRAGDSHPLRAEEGRRRQLRRPDRVEGGAVRRLEGMGGWVG